MSDGRDPCRISMHRVHFQRVLMSMAPLNPTLVPFITI